MWDTKPGVVVGVDGTPASKAALNFAVREAAMRGSAVEVVTAWTWAGPDERFTGPATPHEARDRAQRLQDKVVAEVLADVSTAPVISRQVLRGDPATVLLHAARGAAYLVVGSAHKGIHKRTLLGSVSEQCVRHARCPVVVIPTIVDERVDGPLATSAG